MIVKDDDVIIEQGAASRYIHLISNLMRGIFRESKILIIDIFITYITYNIYLKNIIYLIIYFFKMSFARNILSKHIKFLRSPSNKRRNLIWIKKTVRRREHLSFKECYERIE